MPTSSHHKIIFSELTQGLVWLLDNACNNGFNTFLVPESSIILNSHPLTVTNFERAALRRGEPIFTEIVLKSPRSKVV